MLLKPQDILVLLKICTSREVKATTQKLSTELGLSQAEVHLALKRSQKAGLLQLEKEKGSRSHKKIVNRAALLEIIAHGLRYLCPPDRGGVTRGVPTASAAVKDFGLRGHEALPPVWPDPLGEVRGLSFSPLYESVPFAAKREPKLYEALALVDSIRGGQVRERKLAENRLRRELGL